jgi:hypothetical protein
MMQAPEDLGRRIVQAARLAATLHRLVDVQEWESEFGRRAVTGKVRDDTSVRRSPWTLAGEDPAGSFVA